MAATRIIKKYPNRRLYDTELSHYITLTDVRDLVLKGIEFKVIAANTDEDLTRNILLQVITEQESDDRPLLTSNILVKMIRFYGDSVQDTFTSYLDKSLDLFIEQQKLLRDQVDDAMAAGPANSLSELPQRDLKVWDEIQDSFLKSEGVEQQRGRAKISKKPVKS